MKKIGLGSWFLLILLFTLPPSVFAGWDFSRVTIPEEEIKSGGPPKDGIPALTNPQYLSASEAMFMQADEEVIGIYLNGVARAYPIRILSWHELVNDRFGDLPVLVSW